ncbi:hypothetical protein B0H14DRAFT_2590909 [Mycena olivaceomarginata]|nr:hypothetical protein B0H14DRAFT_2590909 [Mycena olivaceomarginata]
MSLKEVFSLELKNVAPRAIAFGQIHFNNRDIMVFGLYGDDIIRTSVVYKLGVASQSPQEIVTQSLTALVQPIQITTIHHRAQNLYRLEDHKRVKTFPVTVTKQKIAPSGLFGRVQVHRQQKGPRHHLYDLVGSNKIFVWRQKSKKRFGVVGIACVLVAFGYQNSATIPMYNI